MVHRVPLALETHRARHPRGDHHRDRSNRRRRQPPSDESREQGTGTARARADPAPDGRSQAEPQPRPRRDRPRGRGIVVVVVVVQPGRGDPRPRSRRPRTCWTRRPTATTSAGCDDVQTIGFYDGVDDPETPTTPTRRTSAPTSAFPEMPPLDHLPEHAARVGAARDIPPGPLPAGVYDDPPDLARVLHSLEHGASVVWYSPTAIRDQLDQLRGFYDQTNRRGPGPRDRGALRLPRATAGSCPRA